MFVSGINKTKAATLLRRPILLTEKILSLLQEQKLVKDMAQRGRKLIEKNFDWELITSQVINLYQELLGTA